jgi:hypothetical protein
MERLKKSRAGHKGAVTRRKTSFEALSADLTELTADEIKEMVEIVATLKTQQSDIKEKDTQIEALVPENILDQEIEEVTDYHSQLNVLIETVQQTIEDWRAANAPRTPVVSARATFAHSQDQVKLYKIEPPTFSGSYTDWTSFIDLFDASVHTKASLSAAEKLNYLKAACKGDAGRLIRNLAVTADNYTSARRTLETRYGNKRVIVRNHLELLFNHAVIKSESASELRKLLECYQENLCSLSIQGCNVDEWDPVILYLMTSKLDTETRKQWEFHQPGTTLQKAEELFAFVDARARALESVINMKVSDHAAKNADPRARRTQNYLAADGKLCCAVCMGEHQVYFCSDFRGKEGKARRDVIQAKRLCYNCLQPGHGVSTCPSQRSCRHCGKRHHSMLHAFPSPREQNKMTVKPVGNLSEKTEKVEKTVLANANTFQADVGNKTAVLSTCSVNVLDKDSNTVKARALLDSGSQGNFITEKNWCKNWV